MAYKKEDIHRAIQFYLKVNLWHFLLSGRFKQKISWCYFDGLILIGWSLGGVKSQTMTAKDFVA